MGDGKQESNEGDRGDPPLPPCRRGHLGTFVPLEANAWLHGLWQWFVDGFVVLHQLLAVELRDAGGAVHWAVSEDLAERNCLRRSS